MLHPYGMAKKPTLGERIAKLEVNLHALYLYSLATKALLEAHMGLCRVPEVPKELPQDWVQ